MKISNSKGITLISVVITVIVMIIIASVAISNVVGENSTIERAENAVETEEYRSKKEALQQYLNKYNSKSFVGSENFRDFLKSEIGLVCFENDELEINDFADFNSKQFEFFAENDNSFVRVPAESGYYYYLKFLDETFCVKDVDSICAFAELPEKFDNIIKFVDWDVDNIVTSEDKKIEASGSYAVIENLDLKDFSYDIPAGETVTLKLLADMEITNANLALARSAINLNEGSTLNLQVEANVTVNSTYGQDAEITKAGAGGYAGIHVPPGAVLNLSGSGVLTCYGGDAGDGGTMLDATITGNDKKCAGGGGAGAGIGGNGGAGGAYVSGKGANGGNGQDCGTVNIIGTLTVYAYGGAGGSGGAGTTKTATAGGGGGYPAAGIGGGGAGGAGGTCCAGAGGYTGGTGEQNTTQCHNGLAGERGPIKPNDSEYTGEKTSKIGGCGYFQGAYGVDQKGVDRAVTVFGGKGNQGWHSYSTHGSGDGGTAGSGGTITVSSTNKIYAYNGNLYSDGKKSTPCPIYLQAGINPAKYTYISQGAKVSRWKFLLDLVTPQTTATTTSYRNAKVSQILDINEELEISGNPLSNVDMSKQGVGSGAGYTEVSNGTYTVK